MNKIKSIVAVLIAIVGLGLQAKADVFSFDLNSGNTALSGFTGPFANVNINLTSSTTATVTFTSLTNSGNIYLMGDGSSVALNVNSTTFTVGTIAGTNSGTNFTPGGWTPNFGSQQVDGWGHFNFTIDSFDGYTHTSDQITFTLTNGSGTWGSATDVLNLNDDGQLAASHIFPALFPADGQNNFYNNLTGYAAGNGAGVPDGGTTVMLLGAALGALGMVRRFLRS
jgi:hypothetical protein